MMLIDQLMRNLCVYITCPDPLDICTSRIFELLTFNIGVFSIDGRSFIMLMTDRRDTLENIGVILLVLRWKILFRDRLLGP